MIVESVIPVSLGILASIPLKMLDKMESNPVEPSQVRLLHPIHSNQFIERVAKTKKKQVKTRVSGP